MDTKQLKHRHVFEVMLLIIILGMTTLFAVMGAHRLVVLNLFYVPVILSGYFLGRTSAGVLAVFAAISVTIGMTLAPSSFAAYDNPALIGLALTVWAAVLGLSAILVGTLCDERAATVRELHGAYVGVVEVLSKYLQGADPRVKARSVRIAELGQEVARALKLSPKHVDDVRVAALLHDLGNLEITTQTISKAVDSLETGATKHTFLGTDLVHSLASVLEGALPLLVNQDDAVRDYITSEDSALCGDVPLGAKIIATVRAYNHLTTDAGGNPIDSPQNAIRKLREDASGGYDAIVINTLEQVLRKLKPDPVLEPAYS